MFNRISGSIAQRTGSHVLASIPFSLVLTLTVCRGPGEDRPGVVAITRQNKAFSVSGIEGISVMGPISHSESVPDSFISEAYECLNYPPVVQAFDVPTYMGVKLNAGH